jgi:AcrR family transcriptional regulator
VLPRRPQLTLRDELRESRRGRLICAIADCVAEQGYAVTSVADVIARAGVSRNAFYEQFKNKEDCFLAAYDSGSEAIYNAMTAAAENLEDWEEMLDAVLRAWLESLQADLSFTRAYMIEFWAAGDAARERWKARRDRTEALLKVLHARAKQADPNVTDVSDTLIAAVVGGINRVAISHVLSGSTDPLTGLAPELELFIKMNVAAPSARPSP